MEDTITLLRDKKTLQVIPYKIYRYSSYASCYSPDHILVNNPTDPYSRWSTTTNDHRQFLILEYDSSVVSTIQFGKFSKIHVCNIKEMKITVSYDKKEWIEVFYGGLNNDAKTETHNINYYYNSDNYSISKPIISKYLKIEPLAAWGMNFNYSIWYIQLKGVINSNFYHVIEERQKEKEIKTLRKLLRKYPNLDAGNKVEEYLHLRLYEKLEEYIQSMDLMVFDSYISRSSYTGSWIKIQEKGDWPCPRGGHNMVCIESGIYMYGGWNGVEELGDMWVYDGKWKCIQKQVMDFKIDINYGNHAISVKDENKYNDRNNISDNDETISGRLQTLDSLIFDRRQMSSSYLEADNLNNLLPVNQETFECPGKRSCHKMCSDGENIFLLGKYISNAKIKDSLTSELWVYKGKWEKCLLTGEILPNMYDHNLAYDRGSIYIFGGKTTGFEELFGGLYQIKLGNKKTVKLLDSFDQSNDNTPLLKGRLGHVLLYLNISDYPNTLVVVGGQRGKDYYKNISFYSLDTMTVYETVNFPICTDGRVIQRSILYNTDILVLFTYGKDKESKLDIFKLYSYSLVYKKWTEIEIEKDVPTARTAHQFVFWKNSFYLFGGNIIDTRQNDFWKLDIKKKTREEVKRMAIMTVRKHKFFFLFRKNAEEGLKYLRSKVKECIVDIHTRKIFDETCREIFEKGIDEMDEISQYVM